jgi:hypothetical protein
MMPYASAARFRLTSALFGLLVAAGAAAQPARDPTVPPASASSSAAAAGRPAQATIVDTGPVAVIVRDGRPYLVVGTRLYAQGQMLGSARIERISETEVWLREGKALRRQPVFAGIERRVAEPAKPVPACAAPGRKKPMSRGSPSEICPP